MYLTDARETNSIKVSDPYYSLNIACGVYPRV